MTHIDDQGHVVVDVTRADGSHEDIVPHPMVHTHVGPNGRLITHTHQHGNVPHTHTHMYPRVELWLYRKVA